MNDYTAILTEIANGIKALGEAPSYSWVSPLTVLVSAAIGYWASERTIGKQHARQRSVDKSKKELVFHLLRSEITERWQRGIRPFLFSLLDMKPIDGLGHLATTEIHREDLLVFQLLSHSFSDYYFMEDNQLISEIMHAHMMLGDLVDVKNHVAQVITDYRRTRKELMASLPEEEVNTKLEVIFTKAIESLWNEYSRKIEEIDKQFENLLGKLGNAAAADDNNFHGNR